ncbi:hypothetical protein LTR62_007234 [Meristemomyces frigidus]|uniref:Uncharacterized protein n=1 Tax=Meristemomyces frigidus TaxID=1508187 RepID=A0AAN7TB42_9PEZI|nr:hypothetical protein LTR62_007234 [Meristemomyces frigidus]
MGKRSSDGLDVIAIGLQTLADRFGKRRRHAYEHAPPISPWRCNLTALSQEHNLYFIAYGRDIHVYVPQFPSQAISETPVLILPSQPSQPGLYGHLDPREPHTINAVLVQRLGNDEVIATVRDDGDVEAVLLRHVVQAVARRADSGPGAFGLVAEEIRPIFQSNVGVSAWGLAIHTQARILACSSNAHEIRIFKFGLLQEQEGGDDAEAGPADGNLDGRKMDVTQKVLNGDANIPHIAFCNTGDDPEGRWLLTTDISGYCRVMDLRCQPGTNTTAQKFRFGSAVLNQSAGFDRYNAGWTVMFLDRQSFRLVRSFEEAVGLSKGVELPGSKGSNRLWDLSDTVEHVPDNSLAFTYHDQKTERRQRQTQQSNTSESAGPADSEHHDSIDDSSADTTMLENPDTAPDPQTRSVSDLNSAPSTSDRDEPISDNSPLIEDDDDPEDEGTEDSISYSSLYSGKRLFGNQPYFYHQGGLCEDLPCPILHASVKNVYLLQPSNQRLVPGSFAPPMVGMANPLRQAVQRQFGYLHLLDRMNMHAYIPSLGVVVLASQKGRAVVLSLTKLPRDARLPAEMEEGTHRRRTTTYAMRISAILPFTHQEVKNQRPFQPLHGIAAGPIQGTEFLPEEQKRWRLLMMYQDHSILGYEISRKRPRDEDAMVV